MKQETLKQLPLSRHYYDMPKMLLGSTQSKPDVGGADILSGIAFSVNGSQQSDRTWYRDGMKQNNWVGTGNFTFMLNQVGAQEEINLQHSALPAQYPNGGRRAHLRPEGRGQPLPDLAHGQHRRRALAVGLQRRGEGQRGRGGKQDQAARDVEGVLSGPIMKDKLSLLALFRQISFDSYLANQFLLDRSQATDWVRRRTFDGRLSWRPAPAHRLNYNFATERGLRPIRRDRASDRGEYDNPVSFVATEAAGYDTTGHRRRRPLQLHHGLHRTGNVGRTGCSSPAS